MHNAVLIELPIDDYTRSI